MRIKRIKNEGEVAVAKRVAIPALLAHLAPLESLAYSPVNREAMAIRPIPAHSKKTGISVA